MKRKLQGYYVTTLTAGEKVRAFVPAPLPPKPDIHWTPKLRGKFDLALLELGRLDSVAKLLPDSLLFLYSYVRKEAVLSSMIEGTQSSLSDLLLYEMDLQPGVPLSDVKEVSNYVAATDYGIKRLAGGFPMSLRLLKEIHAVLLSTGRGSEKQPGEFRRSQNWIGGTRPGNASFVPPPPDKVEKCMSDLELFLHDRPRETPVLLKAALVHLQFETIHPFLDGNGRLGRLLITLLLLDKGVLQVPLLYLSLYFKQHRQVYYELLNNVRITGDWEAWLEFFADAVIDTAAGAGKTAMKLHDIAEKDLEKIKTLGRAASSAIAIHRLFLKYPISTSLKLVEQSKLTAATVNKSLIHLQDLKIISELTSQKRNRIFAYRQYLKTISEGIEA